MSLVRWEPFRELVNLQDSINRVFDDNIHYLGKYANRGNLTQGWMFPVDIRDNGSAIVLQAEIPGMNKEDINVSYNDNVITIRGERKDEEKKEGANFIKIERKYGSFSRSFSLDVPVDHEMISASYKNGILEITMPRKEESKGKEIDIEVI
jgi:HSP20 family protein